MTVACVLFPKLALELAFRERPGLRGSSVVLLQGHGEDALVSAVSREGSAMGIVVGMTAAQARRRCPVTAFLADNAGECLDVLEHVGSIISNNATPFVAFGGRDCLFVRLTGDDWVDEEMARGHLRRLAEGWSGLGASVGVGADEEAALVAARAASRRSQRCAAIRQPVTHSVPLKESRAPITGSATFEPGHTAAERKAAIVRLLRRMDLLIEGRGESYRDFEVTLGDHRFESHPRQPLATASEALLILSGHRFEEALADAASITVRLSRRVPDVRVRPILDGIRRTAAA